MSASAPGQRWAEIGGTLPGGPEFRARISARQIVLRVGDRVCIAARWMSTAEAAELAAKIQELTS